ncbi:hypothetical protein EII12_03200 [Buchananella hordeovulneris]|uniref:hypothetical protein n=1 Tax=Buchananella hordeovulneris TaxID=52770 RepID=UPI000F5FC4FF|nr:hypothetical protein [Buchananella hordeovulneris]RRD52900.1 hypothetical protein EII12_03200 [Buchananella hordeovulneris]
MKPKLFTTALIAAIAITGCTSSPLNIVPTPLPTRFTERGDLVVRDQINLTAPPGWKITYEDSPDRNDVAYFSKPGTGWDKTGVMRVHFNGQSGVYRIHSRQGPEKAFSYAKNRLIPHSAHVKTLDVKSIDDSPAVGYYYSLGTQTIQVGEHYYVFRSDGLWTFTIRAPRNGEIPPELREAVLNATWTEVTEPNVKYLGPRDIFSYEDLATPRAR